MCEPVASLYVADELPPWQLSQSASVVPVLQLIAVGFVVAPNAGPAVVVPFEWQYVDVHPYPGVPA